MTPNNPTGAGAGRGDVKAALLEVAHRGQTQFAAAGGVGATLMVAGNALFVGSNTFTDAIDTVQYGLDEGPCLTAVETGDVVWSGSIGAEEVRWPRFSARAAELGLGSVLSAPILSGADAIGSLNLYARPHRTFGDDDAASIQRMAAAVARDLRGLHLLAVNDAAVAEFAIALRDRKDVDVVVGILTDRYALTPRQGRVLLAQLAQHDGVDTVTAARGLIQEDGPQ